MKLNEAVALLRANKFIVEDTDDWDEADMPAGMSDEERAAMADLHNGKDKDRSLLIKSKIGHNGYIRINDIINSMNNYGCWKLIDIREAKENSNSLVFTRTYNWPTHPSEVIVTIRPFYRAEKKKYFSAPYFDIDMKCGDSRFTKYDIPTDKFVKIPRLVKKFVRDEFGLG